MNEIIEKLKELVATLEPAVEVYAASETKPGNSNFKVIRDGGQTIKKLGQALRDTAIEVKEAKKVK